MESLKQVTSSDKTTWLWSLGLLEVPSLVSGDKVTGLEFHRAWVWMFQSHARATRLLPLVRILARNHARAGNGLATCATLAAVALHRSAITAGRKLPLPIKKGMVDQQGTKAVPPRRRH